MSKLVNEDQSGYITGRFIGNNIRKLEDCVQYLQHYNKEGIIINIDYEKAF